MGVSALLAFCSASGRRSIVVLQEEMQSNVHEQLKDKVFKTAQLRQTQGSTGRQYNSHSSETSVVYKTSSGSKFVV